MLQIIHEDNHLIAVNKPAGMLVHEDETGDKPLSAFVKEYIKDRYGKPGDVFLGVIHRLDRPVSGVVVFARTSKGLERMNTLFRDRKVEKYYWAVTSQRPTPIEGSLQHYILKDRSRNVAKAFDKLSKKNKAAKLSTLDYSVIGQLEGSTLLEVRPHTGRPHQIRVQLSQIGCPIRGDLKYGYPKPNADGNIHLHCRKLVFEHPVKREPVSIVADPPHDQIWDKFEGVWM